MTLDVRPMKPGEVQVVTDYFHGASPEHLETLGVDPTRLPERTEWIRQLSDDFNRPPEKRRSFFVIWASEGSPIGFSSTNRIVYRSKAYMHLHIVDPNNRKSGIGTECARRSIPIYFETLRLERLFCEPNSFNVGPNRTLQRVGFKYVKTHKTVPSPINYHQAVTQWVLDRPAFEQIA